MRFPKLDPYILALASTVILASLLPARGAIATDLTLVSKGLIALLFFLHGTRLSPQAVRSGVSHWRLHLTVMAITFGLFPAIALMVEPGLTLILPLPLVTGVIYLCCLPSTVQASIAFTSIARGNVPAAMASASASNILGMALTPLLVGLIMHNGLASLSPKGMFQILLQMLVPFGLGQLLRPAILSYLDPFKRVLGYVDRGAILLVVYSAFSAAVVTGLWSKVPPATLATNLAVILILLVLVMLSVNQIALRLGFSVEDRITILMCGTKKSLVTGAPMAAILFPAATAGVVILPLMLYHQAQMIACAIVAERFGRRVTP